jgi:hypothetical protein
MIISPSAISPYKIPTFQSGGGGFDPVASAFITAAGITGETQQSAANTLALRLKGIGTTNGTNFITDELLFAVYPFTPIDNVTATASSYKFNFINPLDTDAAFRLLFVNVPVFSVANGLEQNGGVNAYARTYLKPATVATGLSFGSTISISQIGTTIASPYYLGANAPLNGMRNTASLLYYSSQQTITGAAAANGQIRSDSRRSATDFEAYLNGVSEGVKSTAVASIVNNDYFILAVNNGSPFGTINGALDFVAFHKGLTDNQSLDLYEAIAAYKTALGR